MHFNDFQYCPFVKPNVHFYHTLNVNKKYGKKYGKKSKTKCTLLPYLTMLIKQTVFTNLVYNKYSIN